MSEYPPTPGKHLFHAPSWMGGARPPVSSVSTSVRSGGHLLWALLGVFAVGIAVPCVLTWLHNHGGLFSAGDVDGTLRQWNVIDLLLIEVIAVIGCGPGALILTLVMFHFIRKSKRMGHESERSAITLGSGVGAVTAFLNLPGYLSREFYQDSEPGMVLLRIALLFIVTGATCGAWIAWQAYRVSHPERGLFPRFSLATLVGWALAWGFLLTVFMPSA